MCLISACKGNRKVDVDLGISSQCHKKIVKIKDQKWHLWAVGTVFSKMNQNNPYNRYVCKSFKQKLWGLVFPLGFLFAKQKCGGTENMLYDSSVFLPTSQVLLISFMQIAQLTSASTLAWLLWASFGFNTKWVFNKTRLL